MLRLRVARKLLWTDTKGELRSPLEEFPLLSEQARSELIADNQSGLVAWEFGVLTDDWDVPESSKLRTLGDEVGGKSLVTAYAVGGEGAPDLYGDLMPLWKQFLSWLLPPVPVNLLISDEIWDPQGKWVPIGPAVQTGLHGDHVLAVEPTDRPRWYTVHADAQQLESLLDAWWPSPLGVLAGVVCKGPTAANTAASIAHRASVNTDDLNSLSIYFCTSGVFDNLGFSVLSRESSWESLRGRLETQGWVDGMPVEFLLGSAE